MRAYATSWSRDASLLRDRKLLTLDGPGVLAEAGRLKAQTRKSLGP